MAFTVVSAIVRDSDGTNWQRGSWKLEFIPNPLNPNISQYQVDGTSPLNPAVLTQSGVMDNTGFFTLNLYDNTSITPVGSSWKLTVCPLSSAQCGFYVFAAAGASLDISGALTFLLPPPRFFGVYPNYGYSDGEVILSNKPGGTYYNVVLEAQKYYNDQTNTWAIVGTGPTGPTGPIGPPGTSSTNITDPNVDLNTLTTPGIYYIIQGSGPNTPNPPHEWNSDMGVLEVFSYSGLVGGNPLQYPYIFQRFQSSQDTAFVPGEFFTRWYWWNGTAQVWSPWAIHNPFGVVQSDLATVLVNYNLSTISGIYTSSMTTTITALNTATFLSGSGASSGLLVLRDNSLGGGAVYLADPNLVTAELLGTSQIAGIGSGSVVWSTTSNIWSVTLASGSIPRTLAWGFFCA